MRYSSGFSLIQLLVGLAVMFILLSVGVPTYDRTTGNARITAATNNLASHINYARSEALKRAAPVTICASADARVCADAPTWEIGWIVFTDEGEQWEIDGDDRLLQVEGEQPAGVSVAGEVGAFRYLPDGSIEY